MTTNSTATKREKPGLNPRQKEFAKLYVATGNASEAYRDAGYAAADADVSASRLLVHAGIQAEIKRIQAITVKSGIEVRKFVLDGLLDLAETADTDSARIRALELLGKTEKMFVEMTEHTVTHDVTQLQSYSEIELQLMLDSAQRQPAIEGEVRVLGT